MIGRFFFWMGCAALMAAVAGCGSLPRVGAAGSTPYVVEVVPKDSTTKVVHEATLESGTTMRVLWTVSGYIIGKAATWGEGEAKALLFKGLDINETQIIFDGQACSGVSFQSEKVNAADYLAGTWQTTIEELGIKDEQVQVVRTNCDLPGFNEYLRLSDRRLIVPINGVFFFFEPNLMQ